MSLYQCPFCGDQVNTVARLKRHLNQHHKNSIAGKDYIDCKFLLNLSGCDHNDQPTSELKKKCIKCNKKNVPVARVASIYNHCLKDIRAEVP